MCKRSIWKFWISFIRWELMGSCWYGSVEYIYSLSIEKRITMNFTVKKRNVLWTILLLLVIGFLKDLPLGILYALCFLFKSILFLGLVTLF